MERISIRRKIVLGTVAAFILGSGATFAVFAAIPSLQGTISGCRTTSNGQIRIIDSTEICGSGQSSLKWDRGVIAYGHIDSTDVGTEVIAEQSHNMTLTTAAPGIDPYGVACINIPDDIFSQMRYATATGSANSSSIQLAVKGKSQKENDYLNVYCDPAAELLVVGGAAYVAVY